MPKKKDLAKDEDIKREIERLWSIYAELEGNKKKIAEGYIEEAAFMRATLKELRKQIDEEGAVDEMPQGDYSIKREHPAVKIYNKMIQRYSSITKELVKLLPDGKEEDVESALEAFAKSRSK